MAKKHLKTLTAPVTWPIKRKKSKFLVRPNPGKQKVFSMPLAVLFRDILRYCKTMKEVKETLRENEVLVDGQRRKDPRYSVALMDVFAIPGIEEYYMMLVTRTKKLFLKRITKQESGHKIYKIMGKTKIGKENMQLNLFGGTTILVNEDVYKVGDSIMLDISTKKIKSHLKLEKEAYVFLIKGSHIAEHGKIESIDGNAMVVKTKDSSFMATKEAVYVVGKWKPEINLD